MGSFLNRKKTDICPSTFCWEKEAKKDNALDQRFKDFLEIFKRNAEGLILMGDKKISLDGRF